MKQEKSWYQSKTKWAGILVGLQFAIPGFIAWLSGTGAFPLVGIYAAVVAILAVFGIRDLPVLNK